MAEGQVGSLDSLSQVHSLPASIEPTRQQGSDHHIYPSSSLSSIHHSQSDEHPPNTVVPSSSEISYEAPGTGSRLYSADAYSKSSTSITQQAQGSFYSLDKGIDRLSDTYASGGVPEQHNYEDKTTFGGSESYATEGSGRSSPQRVTAQSSLSHPSSNGTQNHDTGSISVSNTASEQHQQEQEMLSTFAIPSPPVSTQQSIAAVAALSSVNTSDNLNSIEPPRTLWMGDLDPWLDVAGVQDLWWRVLHRRVSVKLIKPKFSNSTLNFNGNGTTGVGSDSNTQHSGYCFVEFETFEDAQRALALNGQLLPDIAIPSQQHFPNNPDNQKKYFRLNWASGATLNAPIIQSPEYSLFVGDLSASTTEAHLLAFFQKHFPKSIKTVRVMTDPTTGKSRCFGFVRFTNESERQQALIEMNGVWLGGRPIRVALASPRYGNGPASSGFSNSAGTIGGTPTMGPPELGMKGISGLAIPDLGISESPNVSGLSYIGLTSHPDFQSKPSQLMVAAGLQPPDVNSGRGTNFGPIPASLASAQDTQQLGGGPGQLQGGFPAPPHPSGEVMFIHPFPPQLLQASSATFPPLISQGTNPTLGQPQPPPPPPQSHPQSQLFSGVNSRKSSDVNVLRETRQSGPQGGMVEYGGNLNNQSSAFTDPTNTTVFIGGLSSEATEDTLYGLFEPFGLIQQIKIPPGKNCGFVKYQTREEAENAISTMQGFVIGGNRIRLSWGRISVHNRRFQMQHQPHQNQHQSLPHSELIQFHGGNNAYPPNIGFGIQSNSQQVNMFHSPANVDQVSPAHPRSSQSISSLNNYSTAGSNAGVVNANINHQHTGPSPSSTTYGQSNVYHSSLAPTLKSNSYDFSGSASSIRGGSSGLGDSGTPFGSASKAYTHMGHINRLSSNVTVPGGGLERSRGSTSSGGSQRSGDIVFSDYNSTANRYSGKGYSDYSLNHNEMANAVSPPDDGQEVSGIIDSLGNVELS